MSDNWYERVGAASVLYINHHPPRVLPLGLRLRAFCLSWSRLYFTTITTAAGCNPTLQVSSAYFTSNFKLLLRPSIMATMRGRKRTDDPTPNRARDIQRAFRARRAAHLESLEQRIRELDEENNYFRKMLNLPVAIRPPLGKGPTGRGMAKSRSRLNLDGGDGQCGSPEPSSETSSTPPMDYGMPIPATTLEVYPPLVPNGGDAMSLHLSPEMDAKVLNGYPPRGVIYGDGMVPESNMQCHDSVDGPGQILPFGYHGEAAWPVTPDVPLSAEMTPTMESTRYYVYPPPESTQMSQQAVPQAVQNRPVHYGHRRSNTEPQSFGSMAPPFSPSHRSCNSHSFVPIVGHELTPSPPPLSIRSNAQSFH